MATDTNANYSVGDTESLVDTGSGSVNADSQDYTQPSSQSSSEVSTSKPCCRIPVSPWPVYIVAILYFLPTSINEITLNSVLYNKLCHQKYQDLDLCSNKTFTQSHPDLQVW